MRNSPNQKSWLNIPLEVEVFDYRHQIVNNHLLNILITLLKRFKEKIQGILLQHSNQNDAPI